ncbi:MAG: hypothetical protein CR997_04675 [Acidobacteria bacterium]|nr:MAG: hypothetical protein CR997_04675 [Acidobacteriota bacterium]
MLNVIFLLSSLTRRAMGVQWTPKEKVLAEAKRNDSYFTLLSNHIKDPLKALATYRNKDLVEKAFGNIKARLEANKVRCLTGKELRLEVVCGMHCTHHPVAH